MDETIRENIRLVNEIKRLREERAELEKKIEELRREKSSFWNDDEQISPPFHE